MAPTINTELKIPDLWYDFYARLIPGCAFIAALRLWSFGIKTLPDFSGIFLLIGTGYLIGLIAQPISSRIVGFIERLVEKKRFREAEFSQKNWLRTLLHQLGRESRDSLILSKMHGEVTFFVQLGILTLIFGIQNTFELINGFEYSDFKPNWYIYIIIFIFFILCAFDFAIRRIERAQRLKKIIDSSKA